MKDKDETTLGMSSDHGVSHLSNMPASGAGDHAVDTLGSNARAARTRKRTNGGHQISVNQGGHAAKSSGEGRVEIDAQRVYAFPNLTERTDPDANRLMDNRNESASAAVPGGRGDHALPDIQASNVFPAASDIGEDQKPRDSQTRFVLAGDDGGRDQEKHATHACRVDPAIITDIRETYRRRRSLLRAETSLTLQIKAHGRSAAVFRMRDAGEELPQGKFPPVKKIDEDDVKAAYPELFAAREVIHKGRKIHEKRLSALVALLPVHPWLNEPEQRGFGAIGLSIIVGECGDLSLYASPAKVWKRFGLAPGQRKYTDKAKALEAGYSPQRRSAMFTIGDSLIKGNGEGPYRSIYLARKQYEVDRAVAEGKRVLPAAKIKKSEAAQCMSEMHVHRRAQRYMEKRLLRQLWRAWRDASQEAGRESSVSVTPSVTLPAAPFLNDTARMAEQAAHGEVTMIGTGDP